jgi:two-component system response regulator
MILLVEDNPDDVELTLRAFRKVNLKNEIEVATDGALALERLNDTTKTLPSLVLLDLKLPRIDGLEVLRTIRATERMRLMPVVVLTSSKEEADIVESYRLGANSYVRKPVDFSEFVEATRQLGLYWLVLNQAPPTR